MLDGGGPIGVGPEYLPDRDLSEAPGTYWDLLFHNVVMGFAYASAAAAQRVDKPLSVLDWGGGVGHHHRLVRALFPEMSIEYHVRDLPSTVAVGRDLCPEVTFWDDDGCFARTYDFVVASASLQYARDWSARLASLARASTGTVAVLQLPVVHRAPSFVVLQRAYGHGYDTEYAGCFRRADLLAAAERAGLELRRELLRGFRPPVAGAPERPEYRGYLFTKARRGPTPEAYSLSVGARAAGPAGA